ncbi:MAG TPA: hypothetical protein VLT35_04710, partial [Methanocella sp.]|nr:hypothetical protein [Methanocella sp.]
GQAPGDRKAGDDARLKGVATERLANHKRVSIGLIAASIGFLGIAVLIMWLNVSPAVAGAALLMPTGVSLIVLALLLFLLSPARYIRDDVCDAMTMADTLNVRKMLARAGAQSSGILLPPDRNESIKLFVPLAAPGQAEAGLASAGQLQRLKAGGEAIEGIKLYPPGYALFQYAKSIGAKFTADDLEDSLKDVLDSGLELASDFSITGQAGRMTARLGRVAGARMCASIRRADPAICRQTGCPICSFVGCAIVEATGKMARVAELNATGKTIDVTFELIGD